MTDSNEIQYVYTKDELLKVIWYHPKIGFTSEANLYQRVKEIDPNIKISHSYIKKFLDKQKMHQIFKPNKIKHYYPIHHFSYRPFQRIQIDLLDMQNEVGKDPHKFVFTCICIFSRYAISIPIKNKTTNECS